MPSANIVVETPISNSSRCRQLEGIFDVPRADKCRLEWKAELPFDDMEWNVGLIVGPSGSGKTSIARQLFGAHYESPIEWGAASVIDDFASELKIDAIANVCQAVGFNTIPAWMRPYHVLSNGEKFRVELARRMIETSGMIVMDEFTSVVDRQVAKIGSHAVQKYARREGKQFVGVTCHYDVLEWLQPDWVYDVPSARFEKRCLRRRPSVECEIRRVEHSAWRLFAPYHYMTGELHKAAQCFCLFVNDQPAAFAGVLHFPHAKVRNIKSLSRLVTLPDFQGMGFAFVLCDFIAACYKAAGFIFHTHPAHPALIRAYDRSPVYELRKRPASATSRTKTTKKPTINHGRPCATFRYVGPAQDIEIANKIIAKSIVIS
jgi:predicted ABC-type transport system involved in lysophospholipase L1 biosynthesis ATPase subunit/GNAT superfamily N-acetyltransferase